MVLFYYDFPKGQSCTSIKNWPNQLSVEPKRKQEEIDSHDLQKIVNIWNRELALRDLEERFKAGATLWLVRSEGELAGYGWTLLGHTLKPHYVRLGANDVHLFDFLVFPEYRGRRINPLLVTYILNQLAAEDRTRAYIEVAEWNRAQLTSLGKTDFHLFGVARKLSLFGRTIVEWGEDQFKSAKRT